jgi:hypothetical protein
LRDLTYELDLFNEILGNREQRRTRELEGRKLAQQLADFANAESDDSVQSFINELTQRTHRTLQQSVFRLFCRVIFTWANVNKEKYDLRNQFTIKSSQKIVKALDGMLPPVI